MSLFTHMDLEIAEAEVRSATDFQLHIPLEEAKLMGVTLSEFKESDWQSALNKLGIYTQRMSEALWKSIQSDCYEFAVPELLKHAGFSIERDVDKVNRFGDLVNDKNFRMELKTAGVAWDGKTPLTAYKWSLGENNHLDMPVMVVTKSNTGLAPKRVEVLPLWGFLGTTKTSPIKVHRKNGNLNNLRPVSVDSRFRDRPAAILAARELGVRFNLDRIKL